MGLLDNLMSSSTVRKAASQIINKASKSVSDAAHKAINNKYETFSFASIPQNLKELQSFPESSMNSPYKTTALCMIALMRYETSYEDCYEMVNFLKGPNPMNPAEQQFLDERLENGKAYKVRSFFAGATMKNNYTPSKPYSITVFTNEYSNNTENYCTVWLNSSGADNPRSIVLRKKPSTGQWFIVDIQALSDIQAPPTTDPWA